MEVNKKKIEEKKFKKKRLWVSGLVGILILSGLVVGYLYFSEDGMNIFSELSQNGIINGFLAFAGAENYVIAFVPPTPDNGTTTANTPIEINVSLTNADDLEEFIFNWNNTNETYYNNSLVLMYNFAIFIDQSIFCSCRADVNPQINTYFFSYRPGFNFVCCLKNSFF